jgi:hypothetical protein
VSAKHRFAILLEENPNEENTPEVMHEDLRENSVGRQLMKNATKKLPRNAHAVAWDDEP